MLLGVEGVGKDLNFEQCDFIFITDLLNQRMRWREMGWSQGCYYLNSDWNGRISCFEHVWKGRIINEEQRLESSVDVFHDAIIIKKLSPVTHEIDCFTKI